MLKRLLRFNPCLNQNRRLFSSTAAMPYNIELIDNGKVILATMSSNAANFFNEKSLSDWNSLLDEIEDNANKDKYSRKPVIFTSPEDSKCFSAGMDLKAVSKIPDIASTRHLFGQFEDLMARISTLQRRTVAKIHGHSIAGGFFLGLACDVRCGLDDDKIGIGITEIEVGIPFPSLMYLMILNRIPGFSFKVLVSQPNKLFTPKEAYDEGYFTNIAPNKQDLMKMCIDEANRVHPDSMEAYLSVKDYLWTTNIAKQWQNEKEKCMDEFARIRNTEQCQNRMNAMLEKISSSKKAKL